MTDSLSDLRRKADHYRLMSYGISDERARSALRSLAAEYDNRAAAAESEDRPVERVLVDC